MPDPHLLMQVVPFAAAVWWTKHWLMDPIVARWRFAAAAFTGAILWVYLAYASTRVVEASGGVSFTYGSAALSWFCVFMTVVSIAGLILGLLLWTEEELEETGRQMPSTIADRVRGD